MASQFSLPKVLVLLIVVLGIVSLVLRITPTPMPPICKSGQNQKLQESIYQESSVPDLKCQETPAATTNSVRQLLKEAEDVWKASKLKKINAVKQFGPFFQQDPWSTSRGTIFWDLFTPSYHCPRPIERIGRIGEGGKWVCGFEHIARKKPDCVVYSFGIGWEITFEEEVLERSNCTVRMYDPTISVEHGPAANLVTRFPDRSSLHKIGLGSSNTEVLRTLRAEMELNGDNFIDILKIDAEGAEFTAMEAILEDFPERLPFGQLQMELHMYAFPGNNTLDSFLKWFNALEEAGLRPFFTEPNQIPSINDKVHYLAVMEYSFLNANIESDYFYE